MDGIIGLLSHNKPVTGRSAVGKRERTIHHPFKQKQVRQEESQKNRTHTHTHTHDTSMTSFRILLALTEKADAQEEPAPSEARKCAEGKRTNGCNSEKDR